MRNKLIALAAGLVAIPLMSAGAQAATCISDSVANYETSGFSCDWHGLTFSAFDIQTSGSVTLGNITPVFFAPGVVTAEAEAGLSLHYTATAAGVDVSTDVLWQYTVTGNTINDAYLSLNATVSGGTVIDPATAGVTETFVGHPYELCVSIPNGCTKSAGAGGGTNLNNSDAILFDPLTILIVSKDQANWSGNVGITQTSQLVNAFSLSTSLERVPLPGALWLFGSALAGSASIARWRRSKKAA